MKQNDWHLVIFRSGSDDVYRWERAIGARAARVAPTFSRTLLPPAGPGMRLVPLSPRD